MAQQQEPLPPALEESAGCELPDPKPGSEDKDPVSIIFLLKSSGKTTLLNVITNF